MKMLMAAVLCVELNVGTIALERALVAAPLVVATELLLRTKFVMMGTV
jgi:hypothetical protein